MIGKLCISRRFSIASSIDSIRPSGMRSIVVDVQPLCQRYHFSRHSIWAPPNSARNAFKSASVAGGARASAMKGDFSRSVVSSCCRADRNAS